MRKLEREREKGRKREPERNRNRERERGLGIYEAATLEVGGPGFVLETQKENRGQ